MATACGGEQGVFYSTAPTPTTVVGSGRMVSESRPVQGFHTVVVAGGRSRGGDVCRGRTPGDHGGGQHPRLVETVVTDGRLTIGWRPGTGSVSSLGVVCRIGARACSASSRAEPAASRWTESTPRLRHRSLRRLVVRGIGSPWSGSAWTVGRQPGGRARLTARFANAMVSGASVARLRVVEALVVNASGASLLEFFGDPGVQADTSGASFVRRIGRLSKD